MLFPVPGPVTQGFRSNPQWSHQLGYGHTGMDQAVDVGTPVVAIADGTVIAADWGQNWPRGVTDRHAFIFGSPNSGIGVLLQHDGYVWGDFHLSSTHLNPGDRVKRGDVVGLSGNTGLSTGPHVHEEAMVPPCPITPMFGRYDPMNQIRHEQKLADLIAASVKPHQRVIGVNPATMRSAPRAGAAAVATIPGKPDHPANGVENFTGYIIGEEVNVGGVRSNIWYVDNGDDGKGAPRYVWAGMFVLQVTKGLKNLTPTAPAPKPSVPALKVNQRLVGSKTGAVMRKTPLVTPTNLTGRVAPTGGVENFTHFTRGEKVTQGGVTTDLWYKDSDSFSWAGSYTAQSTTGLVEWRPPATIPDTPPPPSDVTYTFVKSVDAVTEVLPAQEGFFELGNFPTPPAGIVIHEFNAEEVAVNPVTNHTTVHLGSVISAFTNGKRVASAHWAVEGDRIVQFVNHTDRAYHAGAGGNDLWSIETYGGQDPATMASVVKLIVQLEKLAGKRLPLSRHRDHAATKCGAHINIAQYEAMVAAAVAGKHVAATEAAEQFMQEVIEVAKKYDIRSK